MFSKKTLSSVSLLLAVTLAGAVSCTNFLDEKRESPQTIEMSNARFTCLQALPEEINQFLQGTVSDSDIHGGFDCAKDALVYFKNKTKGTFPDAYTMEDLRNFFGKYFLKKNNVSSEFGGELFKLKQVLLGGSDKYITKTEIQRLVELLDVVRDQATKVAPYMPTLLAANKQPTWIQVDQATDQFSEGIWQIFKQIDVANSNYSFEDLKKFMDGLEKFINVAEPFYLTAKLGSHFVLVEAAKNVLIGDRNNLRNTQDWHVALNTVMGVYREALRYVYFIKIEDPATQFPLGLFKPKQMSPLELEKAVVLVFKDALDLLEKSLPVQRDGVISFASIDNLLDTMETRGFMPRGLSSASIKETYKKVILRMLDPQRRGDSRGLVGLERNHIVALKHEVKIFQLHQEFIDSLKFDAQSTISFTEIDGAVKGFNADKAIADNYSVESLEQEALREAWIEGKALLIRKFPVFFNQDGRQVIMGRPDLYRQTWGSLTRWNVMRALSRAMLLGYGNTHNPVLSRENIVESGLEQWYSDFNTLGVELKAFDPRSVNSGARSFKEANFFTSGGNGDNVMDANETFDFVSLLVSGGMSSAESIRLDLLKTCALNDRDVFDYPWMDETCFSAVLRRNFPRYFNNLPGMVLEIMPMKDDQWKAFYGNLMASARAAPSQGGKVETSELRTAVMLLHYTESLMSVYDENHDGKLNREELKKAAPRFLEFMKSVSPVKADFMVTDFFLFLVYKGKKPTLGEYTLFQTQKAFGSLEDVGRDKILQVFNVLKSQAATK